MANTVKVVDFDHFREKLIELMCSFQNENNSVVPDKEGLAEFLIANDIAPVVRCKDCKWAEDFSHSYCRELFADGALNCAICRGDSGYGLNCSVVLPNDFCSDGERREGE